MSNADDLTKRTMAHDESHLPVESQSIVFRLRKRSEIRGQISSRKSVKEGAPDRISDSLNEAADTIESLTAALKTANGACI